MVWQKTFTLGTRSKGCHLVTDEVSKHISEGLQGVKAGMLFLFLQHTSAALSMYSFRPRRTAPKYTLTQEEYSNENFDPDVRKDMTMALDHAVPESLKWIHTDEGPDDSVSHTKSSVIGVNLTVPITNGKLNLGTWQGIYLLEFRKMPHSRRIVATIMS